MNKKIFFFLFIILISLGYIFKIDKIILIELIQFTNEIKSSYKNSNNSIKTYLTQYFNQVDTINNLQIQVKNNNNYKLKYLISRYELKKLQTILLTHSNRTHIKYVEVLSYYTLNDFSKVILDTDDDIGNNILALASKDGQSAGIVIKEDNQIIAYLNQNEKCNYAVFIGDNNAPGITSGTNKNNNLIIKHIPKWNKIKIHDKVFTSGMDNIFPKGLSVGEVIKVLENEDTKTAIVKTSNDTLTNNYFYILKK